MSRINKAAILAAGLLATSALSGVAHAQMSYSKAGANFVPAQQGAPVVNFTQGGTTYETQGQVQSYGGGYTKGGPVVQYAPVEYVQEQPTVYEAAVVPVVELDEVPEVIVEEPGFIDADIDTLIDELAEEDLSFDDPIDTAVANFIRVSGGYGFANVGTLNYGSKSGATDYSLQDHYVEETQLRGPSGSFRADVASFFVDGGFGQYAQTAQTIVTDDLEGVDASVVAQDVGPEYSWVDGTQTYPSGYISGVATTGTYVAGDVLNTTYDRTSDLIDFGGAVGYSFNFGGIGFGVGVGGRRIQGTHTIGVAQQAVDANGDDFVAGFTYADHTLEVAYAGNYVGPVVRVNFDQNLGGRLSAHVGGTAQALYGQRTLDAKQTDGAGTTFSEMAQVAATGFAFGGELDAGVGFAVSDNISLSVGGFGSFLSAAPGFKAYDTDLATDGTGDFATMTDQSLVTYGLKGSLSLRF